MTAGAHGRRAAARRFGVPARSLEEIAGRFLAHLEGPDEETEAPEERPGRPLAEAGANGVAEVRSNFLVLRIMHDGDTTIFASGRYLDRIAVGAAPFRFTERLVILDSRKIDTLLVIPL